MILVARRRALKIDASRSKIKHTHSSRLHSPFGTCQFPPKISSVSRLYKRSSTELPAAVGVSLFHSVFRSRTDAFDDFVCGGAREKQNESYISANCQRSFSNPRCRLSLPVFPLVLWCFFLRTAAAANCPFRLGSGCPRWRLACT